ncbi:hypothetical protein BC008_15100 [Mastigocoleus testarum BC008]|uniref:Lipopolysaccharide biosynthesis protein n=2 Tax=Mastigocoleus TaxID=996924 RepID=A0A0V7ZGW0_9CYAN|nr:hypothetical protein BC008_14575 [Mastigocoleus testarum BC008]KST63779.1 hypothetical protein BC008_15100 [Mastigocoleus testarum BC008]
MKVSAIIQRLWLPLLGLNGVIVGSVIMIATFSQKTWTANAQLILPDTTTNLDASLGTLGQLKEQGVAFTNELNPLKVLTSIITSDDAIRPVLLSDPEKDKFRSLSSYKKLFKVKPTDQSTNIQLQVTASEPELAKQRAKRLIESYQERLNELRQGTANAREQFTQRQLKDAERNLQLVKSKLAQFKKSTGFVSDEEQTKNLVTAINTLRTTQTDVLAQAKATATRSQELSRTLGMAPQQAINSLRLSENKEYQALRQKLTEVNTEIAVNRGTLTEEHPTVRALLQQRQKLLMALNRQLNAVVPSADGIDANFGGNNFKDATIELIAQLIQVESESKGLQQQVLIIQNKLERLQTELKNISTLQAQLLDLQRQYDIAEGVYKGIVAQLEQSKIAAFNAYPNLQVLDQPTVDPKPTSPKKSLIAIGGILTSVFASLALILFSESRNPLLKQKDLQDIELPLLARIPIFKSAPLGLTMESDAQIPFQRLASTISLMSLENHRLMVTSSTAGEGKTTVTLGLAKALMVLGFRVLMVDGDFRKAKLSRQFGHVMHPQSNDLPQPMQISPGLDILPTAPNQNNKVMEFVARGGFEKYLNTIQTNGNYDYVIVDTAPVTSTSETALMAKVIANVLPVIRLGISDRYMVQETIEQLMRHNANIIGLALNGIEQRSEGYIYKHDSSQVNS